MYFYTDSKVAGISGESFSTANWNATKIFLGHFSNLLFLQFVTTSSNASEIEKRQARKEMEICERKLKYWRRHANYVHEDALRGMLELKKNWRQAA